MIGGQPTDRAQQRRLRLLLAEPLIGPGIGADARLGLLVLDGLVASAHGLHRLAIRDGEDPRRQLARTVEAVRLVPDDQHGVIENLLDQRRPVDQVGQKPRQPRVIAAIEFLERAQIPCTNPGDQARILLRAGPCRLPSPATRHAMPAQDQLPCTCPLVPASGGKVQNPRRVPGQSPCAAVSQTVCADRRGVSSRARLNRSTHRRNKPPSREPSRPSFPCGEHRCSV